MQMAAYIHAVVGGIFKPPSKASLICLLRGKKVGQYGSIGVVINTSLRGAYLHTAVNCCTSYIKRRLDGQF